MRRVRRLRNGEGMPWKRIGAELGIAESTAICLYSVDLEEVAVTALRQPRCGPARLDTRRRLDDLPQLLDAVLIERIAEARTQTVTGQVIPATQVGRRATALIGARCW